MADVKGGLPTKRMSQFQNHEVYMAKIRLGASEVLDTTAVLGGAGSSASPVECTDDDHNFLCFYLKANPAANKSGNGLYIEMEATRDLALYNRTIYATVTTPAGKHPRNPQAIKALSKIVATGYVQGTTTAITADVELPNEVMSASMGSIYGVASQIVLGGTTTAFGAATRHAIFLGKVTGGDATAQKRILNVFDIETLGVGNMAAKCMVSNADSTTAGCSGGLQVRVNGTQYWIPLYTIA